MVFATSPFFISTIKKERAMSRAANQVIAPEGKVCPTFHHYKYYIINYAHCGNL